MRLINIHTLEMREFPNPPKNYAMLSHRWSDEELTFQNYHLLREINTAGTRKVIGFCDFVRKRNKVSKRVKWVWVDSCCIDKRSSAELSEAINSMYAWYKGCSYCVAYLTDVYAPNLEDGTEEFESSEYFTRGWTLGELLAPGTVYFCNFKWQVLGIKQPLWTFPDRSFLESLARATGIISRYLFDNDSISGTSVAQRFSWASARSTTKPEDMAYCLMGLFGIHMPLLYGEGGNNAFRRLQEEIIKRSNDESIFAWTPCTQFSTGLLAREPDEFRSCRDIYRIFTIERQPYTITHKGLRIRSDAIHVSAPWPYYVIPLNCVKGKVPCMVMLEEDNLGSDVLVRKNPTDTSVSPTIDSLLKHCSKKFVRDREFYVRLDRDSELEEQLARIEVEYWKVDSENMKTWHYLFGYTDGSGNFVPPDWHEEVQAEDKTAK